MIKIEKLNESYLRILTEDRGLFQEMHDFFTFEVPGARYTPQYRNKLWDGKIRLLDANRKTLYVGLEKYVREYAENNGVQVESYTEEKEKIDIPTLNKFIKWLDPHDRGAPIEARDYQVDAIHKAINEERTLLLSPTASGKSFIIYCLLRYHLEHKRSCIVIVPTTSLVEQLYSNFEDYSFKNGWKAEEHCQKLYSGFSKEINSPVLLTTWQSIYKMPESWFKQFDVVFGDEAHLFKANSLTAVMSKMVNVRYRIGTTGTIDNSKVNKLVLEGVFGPVHRVISTKELMDTNQVTKLKIKCIVLNYSDEVRQMMKNADYQEEMKYIISCEARNKFIRNLSASLSGNTLVLFQMVEKHGKLLYDDIVKKVGDSRKVFFIYGKTETDERETIRKGVEGEENAIIIASYGVFSTGINIPSIENIVFAHPNRSKIRNLQSIGRGLRLKDGKTECKLYDISDNFSWKKKSNHTLRHLAERVKIYTEEKFDYDLIEVKID
jgi:superfamily II DNA or RNA helicase